MARLNRPLVCKIFWLLLSLSGIPVIALEFPLERTGAPVSQVRFSAQEHFALGTAAFQEENWDEAIRQFEICIYYFPESPLIPEARFQKAVAFFNKEELALANQAFSRYLEGQIAPRHFEEVFQYKLAVADQFRKGSLRRFFGPGRGPRWRSGRHDAIEIYDEVFHSLPHHPMAAEALYGKGILLGEMHEFEEAVESMQLLIQRFPRHFYVAEAYLAISDLYLEHARRQPHNPDLLERARLNLRKFRQDFPTDERLLEAENRVAEMREVLAESFFEMGRFYERTEKPGAAFVYYQTTIRDFPQTRAARAAQERLTELPPQLDS